MYKRQIVDQLLKGEGLILSTPWGPNHPYCNEEVYPPEYDPEQAKQILDDAGWDSSRELLMMVPTGNKAVSYTHLHSWEHNKRTDSSSHEQILQALRSGDETAAVSLLHRDIAYMEQGFLRK